VKEFVLLKQLHTKRKKNKPFFLLKKERKTPGKKMFKIKDFGHTTKSKAFGVHNFIKKNCCMFTEGEQERKKKT